MNKMDEHGHHRQEGEPQSMSSTNHHALYPEYSANAALVLIAVACSLLDRQIAALGRAFAEEGGFTERLYLHRRCIGARRLKSYPL